MRLLSFNFKNEAIWIVILSVSPVFIGLLLGLIVWLSR
jgi:hypothetical protein